MNVKSFTYEGFDLGNVTKLEAFDIPKHVPVAAPAPRPMFTTEEIELAKNIARDEGAREAYDKAKKEFDEKLASQEAIDKALIEKLVQNIDLQLTALTEDSKNTKQKFSERLGQLALAIARKVSGDVDNKVIEAGISAIISESISKLEANDRINIYLSPKNSEALNNKFTGAAVSIDEKMESGDFRIEWQNGYAERDVKKLWQVINDICGRHSSLEENEETENKELNSKQGE